MLRLLLDGALYLTISNITDRKWLHPPPLVSGFNIQKSAAMTEKPKTPRKVLLKRKKPKPIKFRDEHNWYEKAYARFSISAAANSKKPVISKPDTIQ
jgi:hypothetical protein